MKNIGCTLVIFLFAAILGVVLVDLITYKEPPMRVEWDYDTSVSPNKPIDTPEIILTPYIRTKDDSLIEQAAEEVRRQHD